MNFVPPNFPSSHYSNNNVVVDGGDNNTTYFGSKEDSDEYIRIIRTSPRSASIVSLNQQDDGSKPLGVGFSPGPFDGELPNDGDCVAR